MESDRFWLDFMDALEVITDALPKAWPAELPPENESRSEAFWMAACREEMRTRKKLSGWIRALLERRGPSPMTAIECWLLRRRVEWAAQLGMAAADRGILPQEPLPVILDWALVRTWEKDGCQGMWLHAERGGEAHPETPPWLKDLM